LYRPIVVSSSARRPQPAISCQRIRPSELIINKWVSRRRISVKPGARHGVLPWGDHYSDGVVASRDGAIRGLFVVGTVGRDLSGRGLDLRQKRSDLGLVAEVLLGPADGHDLPAAGV
jgi:hypothetical protein